MTTRSPISVASITARWTPSVLGAFVREAPGALAFLEDAGALAVSILPSYPDYYLDRPGAKPEGGRALDNELFDFTTLGPWAEKVFSDGVIQRMMLRETPLGGSSGFVDPAELKRRADADLRGFGQAMVGRLLAACLARGIEPQLGMKADRLIVEAGRVVGVEFASGRSIRASRGVILATGGFEWNQSLKKTFLRGPLDMPASPPGNTGDGLEARHVGRRGARQHDLRVVGADAVHRRRAVAGRRGARFARPDRAHPAAQPHGQPRGQALLQRGERLFLAGGRVPPVRSGDVRLSQQPGLAGVRCAVPRALSARHRDAVRSAA
jgi:hypothetical protein